MPIMLTRWPRARFVILLSASAPCGLFLGCAGSSWQDVTPHYTPSNPPARYQFSVENTAHSLSQIWGLADGTQLWAVGSKGTILHYSKDTDRWETKTSGVADHLNSIFGTSDGAQLWAVGAGGTMLHYAKDTGKWEKQPSVTPSDLSSIYGTSNGTQLWAGGTGGTTLHYSKSTGRWETQRSSTGVGLDGIRSIFGTDDSAQLWAVGGFTIGHFSKDTGKWDRQVIDTPTSLQAVYCTANGAQLWAVASDGRTGTILHYTKVTDKWETTTNGVPANLSSIFGTSDGAQLWAVGDGGTILRYAEDTGKWEKQPSGTRDSLASVFVTSDGTQLWAVGRQNNWAAGSEGRILHGKVDGFYPYVSEVRLAGAELQVRISDGAKVSDDLPEELNLYGSNEHNHQANIPPEKINAKLDRPHTAGGEWVLHFDPADIGVSRGEIAYLQIELKRGDYSQDYRVALRYDPYHLVRQHRVLSLILFLVALLVATLTVLLFTRPLWNLYLYRKLKVYSVVEQIDIPGLGKILQLVLKLTVLPWFVTHRRTLRAWVIANRAAAGNAWDANFKLTTVDPSEQKRLDIPYVPLPLAIEDAGPRRSLPQPAPEDFDSLFKGKRSVVQVIGQGGGGKTTLARHIGSLALAGGEPGGLKECRLPVWVDEDTTDLWEVIKRKVESWQAEGDSLEDEFLKALIENGLLLILFDRVSERLTTTQEYLGRVHGKLRCNALILTARRPIAMEVAEKRFVYPQPLDSATLLNFMTAVIQHCVPNGGDDKPFATIQSQLELGKRLADLITVRIGAGDQVREIPVLPLPVILFVTSAIDLIANMRSLDEVPKSLPNIYTDYLRRINPKTAGVANPMSDADMLTAAKALAKFAVGSNHIPKEFTREQGTECIRSKVPALPQQIDPLQKLTDNGVLMFKWLGATPTYRFALDPVAEFLAAEAYFDECGNDPNCLKKLLEKCKHAVGFYNALLLTIQARDPTLLD